MILLNVTIRTKEGRFVCSLQEGYYNEKREAIFDIPRMVSKTIQYANADDNLKRILKEYPTDSIEGGTAEVALYINNKENRRKTFKIKKRDVWKNN